MLITFGQPKISNREIDEVVDTLKSGWIGTGKKTQKFEEMFANYKGVEEALALNSCTSALHLALEDLELYSPDEIIVPTMTFNATAEAVLYTDAKLILCDVDKYGNIDPEALWKKITDRTRAVIVVHYTGRPVEMNSILQLADKYNLAVIEDCAHAVEGEYKGKPLGSIGDYGCFSFYATKNITTAEGGMLISKKPLDRIRIKSLHGQDKKAYKRQGDYKIVDLGYKYNMTDIQASLGIHQLEKVEENWQRRKEIWDRYNEAFKRLDGVETPEYIDKHGLHLYTLLVKDRDRFRDFLAKNGISTGVHYKALHLHPFYRRKGFERKDFHNAESISYRTVSLPFSPYLTDDEVNYIIKVIYEFSRT